LANLKHKGEAITSENPSETSSQYWKKVAENLLDLLDKVDEQVCHCHFSKLQQLAIDKMEAF